MSFLSHFPLSSNIPSSLGIPSPTEGIFEPPGQSEDTSLCSSCESPAVNIPCGFLVTVISEINVVTHACLKKKKRLPFRCPHLTSDLSLARNSCCKTIRNFLSLVERERRPGRSFAFPKTQDKYHCNQAWFGRKYVIHPTVRFQKHVYIHCCFVWRTIW